MQSIVVWTTAILMTSAAAACVATLDGNPWPANLPPPSDPASRPMIRGLDRLNVSVRPITGTCGFYEYKVDHADYARARIEKAARERLGTSAATCTVDIRSIDLQLRCFAKGFGAYGSECLTDATIVLSTTWPSGQTSKTGEGRGEGTARYRSALNCETGGVSVGLAMDDALDKALSSAFATAP